jgi:predicted phage terminase large subunit-like protein
MASQGSPDRIKFATQSGPQSAFQSSVADIAVFGGARGGGKTFGLLLEPLRHIRKPRFACVVFRRTFPQINQEGGLWDTSGLVYPYMGATGSRSALTWRFPSGASVSFRHMESESDKDSWLGAQVPLICVDQLETFTERQFWAMLAFNRDPTGTVRPYIRATCNPMPDSWLSRLIAWWWDPQTGYAIPERSGKVRWFVRVADQIEWGDTRRGLVERFPGSQPKSLTFIRSLVTDNKILLKNDPGYLSNLQAMGTVDRERYEKGNWLIRDAAGNVFKRDWFRIVPACSSEAIARVRFWDRAATPKDKHNDPCATVGLKMAKLQDGRFCVEHVHRMFGTPGEVERAMVNLASQDGPLCDIAYMQDPGSAGVAEAQLTAKALAGYYVTYEPGSGDKVVRAKPVSAQCEAGNVDVVEGPWNNDFFTELENFGPGAHYMDTGDCMSGAFNYLLKDKGSFSSGAQLTTAPRSEWLEEVASDRPRAQDLVL